MKIERENVFFVAKHPFFFSFFLSGLSKPFPSTNEKTHAFQQTFYVSLTLDVSPKFAGEKNGRKKNLFFLSDQSDFAPRLVDVVPLFMSQQLLLPPRALSLLDVVELVVIPALFCVRRARSMCFSIRLEERKNERKKKERAQLKKCFSRATEKKNEEEK